MKIEIFGADWCSPCRKTKQLCIDKKLEYYFYDISSEEDALIEARKRLGKDPNSIPKVYVDNELIGGYTEFKAYLEKHL